MLTDKQVAQYRDVLSEFVKYQRKQLGLLQRELAEKSGVSSRTIQRIEGKKKLPDMENLLKICDALDSYFISIEKIKELYC